MVTVPTSTWDSVLTTTLQNRYMKSGLADNVLNHIALLNHLLSSEGGVDLVSGGATLLHMMNLIPSATGGWFSGYDPLTLSPQDGITAAEYAWKQAYWTLQISGLEMAQNASKEQAFSLLDGKIKNSESAMKNTIATGVYSNGMAAGGKQIGGLQLIASDAGTGTVGGINSSVYTNWQNYVYSFAANGLSAGPSTIQTAMQACVLNTTRGKDMPNFAVMDNTYFSHFWQSMAAIQRVTSSDKAAAGFKALEFMGIPVVFDGGLAGAAPSAHAYFLNTNYLRLQVHRAQNFTWLPERLPVNQHALAKICVFAGNLTTNGRRYQSVITA